MVLVTLHYHGTPITPRSVLSTLAGRCFCVSYADPRDVAFCHEIGQSVMLDNGAFSMWRQGKTTDWPGYYRWADEWLVFLTTWAVIPDVIDGSEEDNDALIEEWPFGDRGAPVWHMHESLDRLVALSSSWPRVCVGSSGQYAAVGDLKWHVRMHQAMDALCPDGGKSPTWLHMLRGLAVSRAPYIFSSADSTNIARNHAEASSVGRGSQDVCVMADRIDAVQCPAVWTPTVSSEMMRFDLSYRRLVEQSI